MGKNGMKDRSMMNTRLQMLEELYEGEDGRVDRTSSEQPAMRNELESLRSMKSALDARPPRRPDASTLEAVLQAAADASTGRVSRPLHPRQDRKPRARRAVYLRSAGVATAVLTVLIAVTTVWQSDILETQPPSSAEQFSAADAAREASEPTENAQAGEEEEADDLQEVPGRSAIDDRQASALIAPMDYSGESVASPQAARNRGAALTRTSRDAGAELRTLVQGREKMERTPPSVGAGFADARFRNRGVNPIMNRRPSDILPVSMRPLEVAAYADQPATVDLAWDHSGETMQMYQQIEMIGEGVDLGWEPPSVPLEMLPTSLDPRAQDVQPASERRLP